ncbi:HET-domain-containing protein [Aspergillus caelatus]|uniref:HET-domain-containing protein n=1 Tax=Aspergillus caelatus TaxID=61420 RepID=A0A5N7AQ85_9EURO|nr:HET-domain-containing protein [Aspergillus caelatus]KAE8370900.1 HET-domain-containing protein [Aspergillus caelatus]
MRLINVQTFQLEEFFNEQVPPYAILSHTWGNDDDEVSFRDITEGNTGDASCWPIKFKGCCERAEKDGFTHAWIDTCCIDKTNSVELGEAINSMFRWYSKASVCYVYLSDVTAEDRKMLSSQISSSRWLQRGWTLQELLAPSRLHFFNSKWLDIGSKAQWAGLIETITGISRPFLLGRRPLSEASIAQRMSWASKRTTKRKEDIAYSLLGVFNIMMPMIYGEGDRAFIRLQREIIKETRDDSIFAWGLKSASSFSANHEDIISAGIFASSPADFINTGHILSVKSENRYPTAFGFDRGYIRGTFPLYTSPDGQLFGKLSCGPSTKGVEGQIVGIPLSSESPGEYYIRPEGRYAELLPDIEGVSFTPIIYIKAERHEKKATMGTNRSRFFIEEPINVGLQLVEVEPQDCWWKDDSQIVLENATADNTIQRAWARFRQEAEGANDFLVLFESRIQGSQLKTRSHIMTSSQTTALKKLTEHRSRIRKAAFGKKVATDGVLSIHMTVEQDTVEQGMFVVKLAKATALPTVTVNATFELELQAAVSGLQSAGKRQDEILLEIDRFNQQRGTTLTWDSVRSRLDAINEEKCVLERIEKSKTEWIKDGFPFLKQANSLAETALVNGYVPVLEKKAGTGHSGEVTAERLYVMLY